MSVLIVIVSLWLLWAILKGIEKARTPEARAARQANRDRAAEQRALRAKMQGLRTRAEITARVQEIRREYGASTSEAVCMEKAEREELARSGS
jgi:hypothetical protein